MNRFITLLACAALASAGGIPQYSITEIQPDRSVSVVRGASLGISGLSAPLLSTKGLGLGWGAPLGLGYAEPSLALSAPLVSRSIISQPAVLSSPIGLSAPLWGSKGLGLGLAAPLSSTYITRSAPVLTSKIIRSEPLITRVAAPLAYAEPAPLLSSQTLIARSEPILTSKYIGSAPVVSSYGWGAPLGLGLSGVKGGLIGGPALLGDSLLGGKLLLKK